MPLDKLASTLTDGAAAQTVPGITTGYAELDCHLFHGGWGRKELSCILGDDSFGMTLALSDMARNAVLAGLNVLYVSFECTKEVVTERIGAMTENELIDKADLGVLHVVNFHVDKLKVDGLDAMLLGFQATGVDFDLIIVDGPELMSHEPGGSFRGVKRIAQKWNAAVLISCWANRSGAQSVTIEAADIACSWSNVGLMDVIISLNGTKAEKFAGEARLYWAMSRNTPDGFAVRIKQNRDEMRFLTSVVGVEW
jgi:replicative DNA helicase